MVIDGIQAYIDPTSNRHEKDGLMQLAQVGKDRDEYEYDTRYPYYGQSPYGSPYLPYSPYTQGYGYIPTLPTATLPTHHNLGYPYSMTPIYPVDRTTPAYTSKLH